MYRMRSLLLGILMALSSATVPFTHATVQATARSATAPFKVTALRIQTRDVEDPTGIHDLAPTIPSGKEEYYEEYVRVLRAIPASSLHAEFWIVVPSNVPTTKSKVLFHQAASIRFPRVHRGATFSVKLTRVRITLPANSLTLAVLLKSRITYGGANKVKVVAAIVCDLQKIHCSL